MEMSLLETAVRLVLGLLLLLSNAFFVGTEFALTRLRQLPEEEVLGRGSSALRLAWQMTERLEIHLTGCQLGITISSIGLGIAAEPALTEVFAIVFGAAPVAGGTRIAASAATGFLLLNLLHLVIGEQAPTYLGVERSRQIARLCARPMSLWTRTMSPVILAGDWIAKRVLSFVGVEITRSWTEEEEEGFGPGRAGLRDAMARVLRRGALPADRQEEVMAALEIGDRQVRQIAVPREEIVALRADQPLDSNLATVRTHPHVRYPLVGSSLDDFRGIVYVPELLARLPLDGDRGAFDLAQISHPPLTLPADTTIAAAIDRFQDAAQELALVTEDGRTAGLLTATDAFESITGQLEDPLDRWAGS